MCKTSTTTIHRGRRPYALAGLLVVGLGLFLRSGVMPLPGEVTKYGGDALWALVVFLGLGLLRPVDSTLRLGFLALGVAWAVEFSQLYHATWIDVIRATRMGYLVLGSTFNTPDLPAYALGVALGVFAERLGTRRRTPAGDTCPGSVRPHGATPLRP